MSGSNRKRHNVEEDSFTNAGQPQPILEKYYNQLLTSYVFEASFQRFTTALVATIVNLAVIDIVITIVAVFPVAAVAPVEVRWYPNPKRARTSCVCKNARCKLCCTPNTDGIVSDQIHFRRIFHILSRPRYLPSPSWERGDWQ